MENLATVLMIAGGIASMIGTIWLIVESFRISIWWGLGCLLISPVQFFFLFMHWDVAKKPFGMGLLGFSIAFTGAFFFQP